DYYCAIWHSSVYGLF
nr:immunoglobulin light chain junction region [Macaca mulatta]MOX71325.1 immunoglobulin light chain junction region [Macaca mulatta]MOX71561.1 immunoglobulin light chain junction region [Macaca mulatta]MOX71995.1 immunoglobulin light chain junction region [Macaca mulatta]MOX72359.1 immunoglobulin light chain junction region [Macaca mulatta]